VAYSIDSSGNLTPQQALGLGQSVQVTGFTLASSGKYAYAAMGTVASNQIGQFDVDGNGNLTSVPASTMTLNDTIKSLATDANGNLYAGSLTSNKFYQYTINNTGVLSLFQTHLGLPNTAINQMVVDPVSNYFYSIEPVAAGTTYFGGIETYQTHGTLAPNQQGVTALPAQGATVYSFVIDPSNKYAYLSIGGVIYQYSIQSGLLNPMTPWTVSAGKQPASMVISPNGKYVYVSSDSYMIYEFKINFDGTLVPLSTPAFKTTSGNPPTYLAVDPSSQALYVVNAGTNQTISQYTIGSDGTLSDPKVSTVAGGGFLVIR